MQAAFRTFSSRLESWESLFGRAAEFATKVGRERVISISHSHRDNLGVVAVWYWRDEQETEEQRGSEAAEENDTEAVEDDGIHGPDAADLAAGAGEAEEDAK